MSRVEEFAAGIKIKSSKPFLGADQGTTRDEGDLQTANYNYIQSRTLRRLQFDLWREQSSDQAHFLHIEKNLFVVANASTGDI